MSTSLSELAQQIDARVEGDGSRMVSGCAPIEHAGPDDITFLANSKYAKFLPSTKAAAVIIDAKTPCPPHIVKLIAADPYFAFRSAMVALYGFRRHPAPICSAGAGGCISAEATIHPDALIGAGTAVHPHATVEARAKIGQRCILYPGTYVGPDAVLGDDCVLFPNVVVYDRCVLGNRVAIHANTVIGSDGFGYATSKGVHCKIPQAGIVVIEDDVELGAGCAIERATMGETRIGKGTKFADLISIGHGSKIGKHCLFVSMVGLSGSVEVGDYVVMGGQAGAVGHLKIGDKAQIGAQTGITNDVEAGSKVWGTPAVELEHARRNAVVFRDLYGLAQRVRQLEKQLERRERGTGNPHAD